MTWEIVSGLFGLGIILLGIRWQYTKALLKDTAEALTTISQAVEDNKITKEEAQSIVKELKDVVESAKKVVGKR
jgi:hypothetical protein